MLLVPSLAWLYWLRPWRLDEVLRMRMLVHLEGKIKNMQGNDYTRGHESYK